jgi:hypothetical protein
MTDGTDCLLPDIRYQIAWYVYSFTIWPVDLFFVNEVFEINGIIV